MAEILGDEPTLIDDGIRDRIVAESCECARVCLNVTPLLMK